MNQTDTQIIVCHVMKRPEHDFYIGRGNPRSGIIGDSIWANPFPLPKNPTLEDRAECLSKYRLHVLASPDLCARLKRGELLNKRVACWCYQEESGPEPPPVPYCHGDILRELQAELYEGV